MSTLTQSLLSFSRFCKFHGCDLVPPSFSRYCNFRSLLFSWSVIFRSCNFSAQLCSHSPVTQSAMKQAGTAARKHVTKRTDRQTDRQPYDTTGDRRPFSSSSYRFRSRTDGRTRADMHAACWAEGWMKRSERCWWRVAAAETNASRRQPQTSHNVACRVVYARGWCSHGGNSHGTRMNPRKMRTVGGWWEWK